MNMSSYICAFTLSLTIMTSYDAENSYAYIGDSSGQITVMKVTAELSHVVDTLKKHTGNYCLSVVLYYVLHACEYTV